MMTITRPIVQLRRRFLRLPIFKRLLIGNSIVIIVGAIGGTLLTHYVTELRGAADLWLILLFSLLGIFLCLLVNYWIVKTTLRPLYDLRDRIDRLQKQADVRERVQVDADPDISRLASATNSMLDRLEGRARQLRALSERAINAQEEERKRIARQLHDDTAQSLSILIINMERLESALAKEAPALCRRLAAARQLATRTLEELRKVIYGLRPSMLDDLGLVPAIRWFARSSLDEVGAEVKFDMLDETTRLSPELETTLFRIAQEAINNVVRHASAESVMISLKQAEDKLCMTIEDDGCGFNFAQVAEQSQRLGLLGMQERAELVGGEVTIDSAASQGTRVQACIPLIETKVGVHHG